ncbi:MAG: B12-binding domain-containing radical SAM protein [Promethearchaeota archaeon]
MKISLIFPTIIKNSFIHDSTTHQPLSLAYLASILEKSGHEVEIHDMIADKISLKELISRLEKFQPRVIGVTSNIAIAKDACLVALYIKKNLSMQTTVVMGGPWASINQEFILEKKIADIVVRGEGELVLQKIIDNIDDKNQWKKIKGTCYMDDHSKKIIVNERARFIDDLDSLPFPAWHLLPPSRNYFCFNRYFPFYPVITTRGCPYNCIHCTKFIHGYKIRTRSIENIMRELKMLKKKFGAKEIFIVDDNFTMNRKFCTTLLKEIIKEKLDLKLNFGNGVRADTLTPALVKLMKRAGTYSIALGVESGDQDIINKIGKSVKLETILRAARLIKKHGIFLRTYFILGLPDDNVTTMKKTIDFAIKLDAEYAHFFKATIFPGTRMHEIYKEKTGRDTSVFASYYNRLSKNAYQGFVPTKLLNKLYTRAYIRYYLRPRKILSLISKFRTFQEFKWMFNFVLLQVSNLFKG